MLSYVTTNAGKVREAEEYLGDEVRGVAFDYTEVQADELGPIAAHGAREAYREVEGPVLVDDAGLFVEGLGGFPGPYSSYVEDTVGVEGVYRLVTREARSTSDDADPVSPAAFRCVLAYCDGDAVAADTDESVVAVDDEADLPVALFEGVVRGRIVAPRGDGGFGYDPIFEHEGQTMAEMSPAEKNAVSHRGRALARFADWYATR
jgi:XTP/dITP diphosphohydrolase